MVVIVDMSLIWIGAATLWVATLATRVPDLLHDYVTLQAATLTATTTVRFYTAYDHKRGIP